MLQVSFSPGPFDSFVIPLVNPHELTIVAIPQALMQDGGVSDYSSCKPSSCDCMVQFLSSFHVCVCVFRFVNQEQISLSKIFTFPAKCLKP